MEIVTKEFNLVYKGKNKNVIEAVALARDFFTSGFYTQRLKDYPLEMFAFSDLHVEKVPEIINKYAESGPITIRIAFHASKSTLAWVNSRNPRTINLSSRRTFTKKTIKETARITGTIVHEIMHVLDALTTLDFGHGDNSPEGKLLSCPYWHGVQGQAFALEKLSLLAIVNGGHYYTPTVASAVKALGKHV